MARLVGSTAAFFTTPALQLPSQAVNSLLTIVEYRFFFYYILFSTHVINLTKLHTQIKF